jgi:site-specific DNA recombinase
MVGIYCRVSGDEQKKEETIQTQRVETSNYCQLHSLPVYDYYLDDGVTGMLPFEQRPDGSRLLADARAGRFEEIVVYKTARLGRDFYETVSVLRLLREQGLLVRSVTEHYDAATPDGRFMQGVHAIFAEKAREDIVQQSFDGCNRVAALGTWMGGNRPYGYRTKGQDTARVLVVDDEEAQWVRQIFEWLVEDRMTCNAIARRLNSLGVLTPFAKEGKLLAGVPSSGLWVATRVRNLVANSLYKGVHTYGRKSKIRQPIVRSVAAIVDADLWEAAQRQLDANMKYGCRNRKRQYLLSGKIRCGCGSPYVGIKSHGSSRLHYVCKRRNQLGLRGCSSPNVPAADAEAIVWQEIEAVIRDPGRAVLLLENRCSDQASDLEILRGQIATIVQRQEAKKRERQRLIDLYTSEAISRDDYTLKYQRLNQDEADLTTEEESLREQAQVLQNLQQEIRGVEAYLRSLNARMDDPPTWEQKRELVKLVVTEITVSVEEGQPVLDTGLLFFAPGSPLATLKQCRSFTNWGWLVVPVRCRLAA